MTYQLKQVQRRHSLLFTLAVRVEVHSVPCLFAMEIQNIGICRNL